MLVDFKVGNFLSFKDEVKISLEAASIKENTNNFFINQFQHTALLKCGVLYGSNSAGKSNLIKAISFVTWFVKSSSTERQANEKIDIESFKLSSSLNTDKSVFQIQFFLDNRRFIYRFSLNKELVFFERLEEVLKTRNKLLFDRKEDKYILGGEFENSSDIVSKTRQNALFLSASAQWNNPLATVILKWFQNLTFISDNYNKYKEYTARIVEDQKRKKTLQKILKWADLGFDDIEVQKIKVTEEMLSSVPTELKSYFLTQNLEPLLISTIHKKYDEKGNVTGVVKFNLDREESLGTQKYFALAGPILDSLQNGKIIFIDELDARLHPLLSSLIVRLFNSSITNPFNAQIVFTTHNTHLLSRKLLRRDQVFLVEKDQYGSSKISTLYDKKIRNDASFEKDYLNGEYGGVPEINDKDQLELFNE